MRRGTYTRRQLLGGITALGAVSTGAWSIRRSSPSPTYYTYAQTTDSDDRRLRVSWHETYNGEFQEHQNQTSATNATSALDPDQPPAYIEGTSGPVITLTDVLPGDRGRLAVGLLAADIPDTDEGIDIWMRLVVRENNENGITEPEATASQESPGSGELANLMSTTVWFDTGLAGIGQCDGTLGVNESPLADGSLVAVGEQLSDGVRIADCLAQGNRRCVGLKWAIGDDAGNAIQTDSVVFDLEFFGQPCDADNPWE